MAHEIEGGARRNHAEDDDHRHREMRRETLPEQDGGDHQNRDRERGGVDSRQAAQNVPELDQSAMGIDCDPQHVGQHGDADLHADAGEKTDQRGAREKIGQKPQPENAREQQH